MAQLISVRLSRHDSQALGFRLQGGKDFGTPLVIQKVNGGSPAERAGLLAGDAVIKVNNTDVYSLRHKEAQDAIIAAGQNIELTIQRGGGTWRPSVTNIGTLPTPSGRSYGQVSPVTKTSLRATPQPSQAFGTGHNNVAKPFNYMNGSGDSTVKSIVNRQYNTPVGMYSEETIAETLSAQAEVLAGGVLGVNFKKNEKHYDSEKSEVFKMLQEADNDPEPEAPRSPAPMSGLRHVVAPTTRPDAPINNTGGLPPESSHFYSRASVARCASPRPSSRSRQLSTPRPPPPAPEMSCAGTQTPVRELVPEPVHRPSLPVGCHRALPGGDIQLGAPALSAVAEQLPQVEDTPYCSECNRYIIGVFVRIKDKNLHVECFKCATCGTSLKNQGYYNLNGKLYCDIHAKLIARQNPPAPNLEPVTLSPGGKFPASAITSALANHTTPLPPLSTNNIGNGLSPYSPPSQIQINTSRDQTDEVPGLRMENVEAFNTLLKSESMESSKMVANVQKDLSNLTVNTNGHSNEFATANDGNSAIPNNFRKVIPPHLGGQYKLSSNLSGPRPFGGPGAPQSTPSMASTLSPRSAPMSPAHRPVPPPAPPTSYPVHAPVTPVQISTNKPLQNGLTPTPAKSDTMRKITKFALDNNYEIGIQRKIKPGDHIANMANKIKDTIIMKHPLNNSINDVPVSGASGSPKSSMNSSPSHSRQGSSEKNGTPKQWIPSGGIPPPPPPPPTFTPDAGYKITFDNKPNGGLHKVVASPGTNGKHSSSSSMSSGTLSPPNDSKINGHSIQAHQLTNILLNKLALQKENKIEDKKVTNGHYNKPEERTRTNGHEHKENGLNGNGVHANSKIIMDIKDNIKNKDVLDKSPVRMREKRTDNANGTSGKRDSKVVSRPISTIASLDFAEGVYPICNKCDKQISRGPFITALGRIWCPDHFICVNSNCRRPLQDIGFVEEQGQLYCEYCFEQFIAPACDKCHSKIKGDCLNAIGKHFHPECFNCAYCGKLFGNNPFFLEEGLPYCEADWNELFTTKCFACGFPVEAGDRWVEALNNNYHSQCFNCTMCKKNLEGQSFYAKGGRPFCKNHAR